MARVLLNIFPHLINTFIILYVYYQINAKVNNLTTTTVHTTTGLIDVLTVAFDKSFSKFSTLLTKNTVNKTTQLENHL